MGTRSSGSIFGNHYIKLIRIKFGDFNGWNRETHKCTRDEFGTWTLVMPKNEDGTLPVPHDSRFKCCITKSNWEKVDRIPAWTKYSR